MNDSHSPSFLPIPSASDLRLKVLAMERSRSSEEVARISKSVIQRLLQKLKKDPLFWKGRRVGLYRAMSTELDLTVLEKWLKDLGCSLCYPRVLSCAKGTMDFVECFLGNRPVQPENALWRPGHFGIQEPQPEMAPIDPNTLEIIFVPGMAFGLHGERVGRGAGFYDRFLAGIPQALRVAVTFDEHLFPKIEQNSWDQPVHWVLTDQRDVLAEHGSLQTRKRFFEE